MPGLHPTVACASPAGEAHRRTLRVDKAPRIQSSPRSLTLLGRVCPCTQGGWPGTTRASSSCRAPPPGHACLISPSRPHSPGEGWWAGGGLAKSSLSLRSSPFSVCHCRPTRSQRLVASHLQHNTAAGQGVPTGTGALWGAGHRGLCRRERVSGSASPHLCLTNSCL